MIIVFKIEQKNLKIQLRVWPLNFFGLDKLGVTYKYIEL